MDPVSGLENATLPSAFELEEYKQVLKERHFVMTRYMQAVGLYLALSGFALRELSSAQSASQVWLLAVSFTLLNVVAPYAARQFRNMARDAMNRELHFVAQYHVRQMHDLFWGYYLGLWLVGIDQAAVVAVAILKLALPQAWSG
jgi:hypothetical protein